MPRYYADALQAPRQGDPDAQITRLICCVVAVLSGLGVALSHSNEAALLLSFLTLVFLVAAVFPRTVAPWLAKAIAAIATLALIWDPPSGLTFHAENLIIAAPMCALAAVLYYPGLWRSVARLLSPQPGKLAGPSMRVRD